MRYYGYLILAILLQIIVCARSQYGSYDFNKQSTGAKRGALTPTLIAIICAGSIAFVAGLAITLFFCYHVYKKQRSHMSVYDTTKHMPLTTYVN